MPDIKVCLPLQGAQQPNTSTGMYLPQKSVGPVQYFSTHLKCVADLRTCLEGLNHCMTLLVMTGETNVYVVIKKSNTSKLVIKGPIPRGSLTLRRFCFAIQASWRSGFSSASFFNSDSVLLIWPDEKKTKPKTKANKKRNDKYQISKHTHNPQELINCLCTNTIPKKWEVLLQYSICTKLGFKYIIFWKT